MAALAALLMLEPGAMAQDSQRSTPGAPIILAPPKPLAPRSLGPAREPVVPGSRALPGGSTPRSRAVSPSPDAGDGVSRGHKAQGISVDTLGEIDANSVGVLDANSGGFGVDMWRGSSADTVVRLLARIRGPATLSAARGLARRLLLSAARPPRASSAKPDGGSGPSLLALRLRTLLELGDVESAAALLRVVPVRVAERAVGQVRLNTALLMNNTSGACGEARLGIVKYDGVPWRKAMVFCQFLAGERARAAIGAELLREQGVEDDTFFSLTAILGGDSETSFKVPAKLQPLHLAMMRVARVPITDTLVDSADVGALRSIAFSPNAELDARLAAAERAEAAGALEARSLAQIYGAVAFAPGDISTALTNADALSGPRGRALLYQAARNQKVPSAQAEVLAKAFVLARTQGRLATTVRAFLPLLEAIRPTEDLAWFAAEAARAFFFVGRLELAGQWASLAMRAPPGQAAPNGAASEPSSSPSMEAAGGISPPLAGPSAGQARALPVVSAQVRLWPFMAIAAAGADRNPSDAAARPDVAGTVGGAAKGPDLALPPGSVAAPVEGPTAADALAEVRSVERRPVVDLVTGAGLGAGSAIERETLPMTARVPPKSAFDRAMFTRWRMAQPAGEEAAALGQAALLLTLLDALGVALPTSAWLETVGPVRELGALPQPGLVAALERGAKVGRLGETVLLALAVLGRDAPEKLHPSVIGPVVRALSSVGLVREARALALEVAFEAGL